MSQSLLKHQQCGLKKVINKLIAYDQTVYVKGPYIGGSIRVIRDLIDFADLEEQEGQNFSLT